MTEYLHVEKTFLDQLAASGWTVINQGQGFPTDPAKRLRRKYCDCDLVKDTPCGQ